LLVYSFLALAIVCDKVRTRHGFPSPLLVTIS
jgi:hypothetical protein